MPEDCPNDQATVTSPDDTFWRSKLLDQCQTAVAALDLSSVDFHAVTTPDPPSLYDFFAELAALRNEQKRGNRKFSDVLSTFTSLLENMRDERDLASTRNIEANQVPSQEKGDRSLALSLIDLRDRLDRILTKAADSPMQVKVGFFGKTSSPPAWEKHRESLDILSHHFQPVLAAAGLERIPTKGLPYDPREMKATSSPPGETLHYLHVVRETLPGYRWQGQCLRPAEVEVQTGNALLS